VVGSGDAGVGGGFAARDFDCGGADGGVRSELVQFAGAVSGAGSDGVFLLGGELYGEPDFVAGTGVSVAAGGEDASGGVRGVSE
jgi:hypothetical protein